MLRIPIEQSLTNPAPDVLSNIFLPDTSNYKYSKTSTLFYSP